MHPEIIGIDHVYISVSDMARATAFYDRLLGDSLGFHRKPFELAGAPHVQYYNRHFGYVLRPAAAGSPAHNPYHSGLHHFCLRVEGLAELEQIARALDAAGIAHGGVCHHPEYAPDYHALFLQDPDGIRLEITNYRAERRHRHEHWQDDTGA